MKRISILLTIFGLWVPAFSRAQDAATEERLNKLAGQIQDLQTAEEATRRRLDSLSKDLDTLREQVSKPTGNYASQEDLTRLLDAIKEVDRKRLEDAEKIHSELLKLGNTLAVPPSSTKRKTPATAEPPSTTRPEGSDKGYEYVVKKGDTLLTIAQTYRDNNVKVTAEQIQKANPGLKPERMYVGQKIFIPAPK